MHAWSVTSTDAGRVYAMAKGDNEATPIFEIVKDKAKRIAELTGVEDLIGFGKHVYAIGGSFEDGSQVQIFDGKTWKTHATGDASIHSGTVVDGQLIGIGRDGYVGTWNKTTWKLATKEQYNLMLTAATLSGKTLVVAGEKGGKGILGTVVGGKIKPAKTPSKGELLGLARLPNGQLLATGRQGVVLVGTPGDMTLVASTIKADLRTPVVWDGKILMAAYQAGVVEYAGGALRVFDKAPAQKLAVAGKMLWKLDRKTGLARWTGKAWSTVKL